MITAKKIVAIILLAVCAMASGAMLVSDEADSATQTNLGRVSAQFFTDLDTDYGEMPYLSDELPKELNPAEWARDTNGFWYNVNERSLEYGNVLTYGAVSNVDADTVRSDILSEYSTLFTSDFQLLLVKYTVQKDCNFSITVSKTGMVTTVLAFSENHERGGYYFTGNYQSAVLLAVDPASGDLRPSEVRGTYQITVDSAGETCYSQSQELQGDLVTVSGDIIDLDGNPVPNAVVYYDDGYSASPSVSADASGHFEIDVTYGSTVFIKDLAAENYNFDKAVNQMAGEGYSCGVVRADITLSEPFVASEHTMTVKVLDQSGRPVVGQNLKVAWFFQSGTVGSYYITSTDIEGSFVTDFEGKCKIVFPEPDQPGMQKYLYVCIAESDTPFTWEADEGIIANASLTPEPLKAVLEKEGNAYLDIVGYTDCTLRVKQYSAVVTVTGADGTQPLSGITPDADWFSELNVGGIYNVDSLASSVWSDINDSVVWCDASDSEGKAVVHFCKPAPPADPNKKYYLLVCGTTPADSSIAARFTFDVVSVTGENPHYLLERIADADGMTAIPYDLVGTFNIEAKEKAYTVTYKVTGEVPDSVDVVCDYGTGTLQFTANKVGSELSFAITVQKGMYLDLSVSALGYSLENGTCKSPTVVSNITLTSACESMAATLDRGTPAEWSEATTVSGLAVGDRVSFSFTSSGTNVTVTLAAHSDTVVLKPMGWSDAMITDMTVVLLEESYLYSNGAGSYVSAPMKEIEFVTYNSDSLPSDVSVICSNIAVTAYVDGVQIETRKSNSDGIGTITVPDVSGITYRYGNYVLTPVVLTDGPFKGYTAFNLQGIVDVVTDTYITLTIKYIATSVGTDGTPVYTDLKPSETVTLRVGDNATFTAIEEKHFFFGGWVFGGTKVSSATNANICTMNVTEDLDGLTLTANYSAYDEPVAENPLDMTSVSLGMIGIILAILAFAYVITQVRRY